MARLQLGLTAILVSLALVACATPAAPAPTAAPAPIQPTAAPAVATTVAGAQATPAGMPADESTVKVVNDAQLGPILTDAKGITLYRYTKDQADVSNCYDQCAVNWPPLLVTAGQPAAPAGLQGTLGLTTRMDGAKQVTYNGMPLYYWVKDTNPGDTTGQNVGTVWFVVKPGETAPAAVSQ